MVAYRFEHGRGGDHPARHLAGFTGILQVDGYTAYRRLRPQTITHKNALFAGSDGGGRTWATLATLLTTARLNGIDPHAWLTLTLERLAGGWPNRQIDDLTPWNPLPA